MIWLYELDNTSVDLTEDQTKFKAEVRHNNQVTMPSGILEMISKAIDIPKFDFVQNASVILQVKAIHMNNKWYRLSSKDEKTKRK